MKKVILIIFPIVSLVFLLYYNYVSGLKPTDIANNKKIALDFKDNEVQCPECHMFLVGKLYTAQAITKDGKTHFFDDPGCLVLWLEERKIDPKDIIIWFYTTDTKKWKKYDEVFFSVKDKTPMLYGFGAYEKNKKGFISFKEMRVRMLRGENLTNPKIRKRILQEGS